MRGYTYTRLTICLLLLLCIIATCLIIAPTNNVAYAEEEPVHFDLNKWQDALQAWYELHMENPKLYPYFSKLIIEKDPTLEEPFFAGFDARGDAMVIKFNGTCIDFKGIDYRDLVGLFAFEYNSPYDNSMTYQHALRDIKEIIGLENIEFRDLSSAQSLFRGLSKLESIDLSFANLEFCRDFSYMFYGCISLKSVKMPDTVYGYCVSDIRGMFYNTALTDLDLSNFAPLHLDKSFDYDPEYTYGLDPYPYFLSPNNKLLSFKMPDNEMTQNFDVNLIPESLLNFEFGEFAVDDGEMNICTNLEQMIGYTDTLYRVGEISYVVKYKGEDITFDSDYYLATRPYTSKEIDVYKIQRKISKIVDIDVEYAYWMGYTSDLLYYGKPGEQLIVYNGNTREELNSIDSTGDVSLYASALMIDVDGNIEPYDPVVKRSIEQMPKVINENCIEIDDYVVSDGIEEGSPIKSINTLLVVALSMVGIFLLIFGILAIASARYVDINGKPTLVFITKAGNKYSKCITLKHKKYRVKNRALRKKKNKIDDVVHILNSDKDVEEVPFFKNERF